MTLSIKRFRLRAPDVSTPAPPLAARPDMSADLLQGDDLFAAPDDGFGAQVFDTAKGPEAASTGTSGGGATAAEITAIEQEGLTGRQLRLARRVAQKNGIAAASDFEAVRLLRRAGIDPFQRSHILELVRPSGGAATLPQDDDDPDDTTAPAPADKPDAASSRAVALSDGTTRLPLKLRPVQPPSPDVRAEQSHMADLLRIQRDIATRRKRKFALLLARLSVFVLLPTLFVGYYFYNLATPLYTTKSEFRIETSENPMSAGVGGLLSGTAMAKAPDSIAVQGYLQSREAMLRLDKEQGFSKVFGSDAVDELQRLPADPSQEAIFKAYNRNVKISFDMTEGVIRLQVNATDPETSARFAGALLSYAEEQVDQLTQRMRGDQMKGAREAYEEAERNMKDAQARLVTLQQDLKVLSSDTEVGMITSQVAQLEAQITDDRLALAEIMRNPEPNEARAEPIRQRIAAYAAEVAQLRRKLTEDSAAGISLARVQSELLIAQVDIETRQMLLAQTLESMETARVEANRQTRYLSVSVRPVPPDEPTYPRPFESTMVALLIFAGIYLVVAMTAEVLREQLSA
jgi:capsular polysaccharide transport system permease protein